MIKIQPVVRDIVLKDFEAYFALSNGYMNMSSYAHKIKLKVESLAKKNVTITSLVVALSRVRNEIKKQKPLIQDISIKNITTKLPLTEIVYENDGKFMKDLSKLPDCLNMSREDFFVMTTSINETNIIFSSNLSNNILKNFKIKPKIINNNLAAVCISLSSDNFDTPNVFFSLLSITARARINLEELVSTSTELIFVVKEKDFTETVGLFSKLYKDNIE